jgi:uncharacterized protein YndB with AHSA1/START domain
MSARPVGATMDAGFQIGVRRTVPVSDERIWEVLLSPDGLGTWLGGATKVEEGERFAFSNGLSGEIRVFKPGSHIRLTWHRPEWEEPSYVQVRVIPARTGTTLSFHQDHLAGPSDREEMKVHWEQVIDRLFAML